MPLTVSVCDAAGRVACDAEVAAADESPATDRKRPTLRAPAARSCDAWRARAAPKALAPATVNRPLAWVALSRRRETPGSEALFAPARSVTCTERLDFGC